MALASLTGGYGAPEIPISPVFGCCRASFDFSTHCYFHLFNPLLVGHTQHVAKTSHSCPHPEASQSHSFYTDSGLVLPLLPAQKQSSNVFFYFTTVRCYKGARQANFLRSPSCICFSSFSYQPGQLLHSFSKKTHVFICYHNSWCLSVSSKTPSNTYLDAVIFIQSKPSHGWQVLAATLAFVRLPLRPLLCGVNSRAAIIAGNHLHTRLRSERRAKHLFPPSVKATRLTDMWWCKHTLLCVTEGRHPFGGIRGGGGGE